MCVLAAACSSAMHRVCSPDEVIPAVFVDAAALAVAEPKTVEVCLDRQCVSFGDTSFGVPSEDESLTVLPVLGDHSERTILVRTRLGEVLAGPSRVEIPTVDAGCPGAGLQGHFVVTDDGKIEQEP